MKGTIALHVPKECKDPTCGVVHLAVPTNHRFDVRTEMYYWECDCHSTFVHILDKQRTFELIRKENDRVAREHLEKKAC